MAVIQMGTSGFGPTMPKGNWVSGPIPLNMDVYVNKFGGATVYDPATNTAWSLQNTAMLGDYQARTAAQAAQTQAAANTNPANLTPTAPPPEVLSPFQQSPLAPPAGAVQNPIPPELAPPVFNIPPPAPAPVANVLPPELAPPPPAPLPPVSSTPNLSPQDLGAPPPAAPLPPAAPSINAPPPQSALPPLPPPPPAPAFSDPIVNLQNMQAQASPQMSPLAPPVGLSAERGEIPASPLVNPLNANTPSPLAPMEGVPATPQSVPGQITPVPTQTLSESVIAPTAGGATTIAGPEGTQTPGLTPAAGGTSEAQAPSLAPPGDETGPQPIPFNPNTPVPATPSLAPGSSIEDFTGDLSKLQFGPEGILGVPGGPTRPKGQSEADFLRTLLSQGLFGAGL